MPTLVAARTPRGARGDLAVPARARDPARPSLRPTQSRELTLQVSRRELGLQALTVGPVADPAEHEAERIAKQISRGASVRPSVFGPATLRRCDSHDECAPCRQKRLQRSPARDAPSEVPASVEAVLRT